MLTQLASSHTGHCNPALSLRTPVSPESTFPTVFCIVAFTVHVALVRYIPYSQPHNLGTEAKQCGELKVFTMVYLLSAQVEELAVNHF